MLNRLLDVFKFFQQHEVKYVVIGGVASVLHGVPLRLGYLEGGTDNDC